MKLTWILAVCLCAISFGAGQTQTDETFRLQIEERGILLHEQVEINGDVHIYRVPAHNDILASTVVLDYGKGLKVWYVPVHEKCYVTALRHSKPEAGQQTSGLRKFNHANMLLHAGFTHEYNIGYISSVRPLEDLSFLPSETHEMCSGVPVFWTTAVDLANKTDDTFFFKVNPEDISLPEPKRFRRGTPKPPTTITMCKATDMYQACKISRGTSCFYIIVCPTVSPSGKCAEHVRDTNLDCKICCRTPGYTKSRSATVQHCDNFGGTMGSG